MINGPNPLVYQKNTHYDQWINPVIQKMFNIILPIKRVRKK